MVSANNQRIVARPETNRHFYSKHKGKSTERRAQHIRFGVDFGNEETRLALDRGIYLAQKKLLSGKMAEQISRCLGETFTIQQI